MRDEQGLVAFAREIIGYAFDGMDADGADIHALALAHGLLVKEPYDPARHGPSMEAQPGDDWYTFAAPMVEAPDAALQSRAFEDGARKAEIFARRVHAGQTDKGGAPYTGHLGRVAARARAHAEALDLGEQTAILCAQVGWLHDVIEDCTGEDMSTLAEAGFHPDVCQNVDWLSRNGATWGDGEPFYTDWIEWICRHTSLIAIIVKLSDVEDNLDPSRTLGGSDKLRARYQAAAEKLRAALATTPEGRTDRA